MVDGIDAAYASLANLFFNYMRDQSRRARDHENAIERGGVIPKSARIAPIAPSTLIGRSFFAAANDFSTARAV
jgi:hypothetical protein